MPDRGSIRPLSGRADVNSALMPHQFEMLWHLALITKDQPDALASEVYGEAYARGRPEYQKWSVSRVATVLRSLMGRGLVTNTAAVDSALAGRQTRRWRITPKGWGVLNP